LTFLQAKTNVINGDCCSFLIGKFNGEMVNVENFVIHRSLNRKTDSIYLLNIAFSVPSRWVQLIGR
jgi:hypothetical protein